MRLPAGPQRTFLGDGVPIAFVAHLMARDGGIVGTGFVSEGIGVDAVCGGDVGKLDLVETFYIPSATDSLPNHLSPIIIAPSEWQANDNGRAKTMTD